ncbi:hypothetical protein B0A48_15671 [Cryoendolithus antarcticus]|uniref:Uncharacterized protein n=1 Tax=Cryoendolithus antarcticus TaxID=1507870 RepID=A0A1V8SH34_9PEZI|nr:hypothetical protein B0A48_15671 [Cryoendolithus antarcticus]
MPSDTVSKRSTTDVGDSVEYEHHEQSSKASASAGLNLNVLGALGGVFSSKSSKDTDDADGTVTERKEEHSAVKGVAAGNLGANAAANAEQKAKSTRAQIQDK